MQQSYATLTRDALKKLLAAGESMDHTEPGEACPTCEFMRDNEDLLVEVRKLLRLGK